MLDNQAPRPGDPHEHPRHRLARLPASAPARGRIRPHLDKRPSPITAIVYVGLLSIGFLFTGYSLMQEVAAVGAATTTWLPYILQGVGLLIALGFKFVNGFHDTANAVATVIYTHSLPPNVAVVWSGVFNFLGVLLSTGGVRHRFAVCPSSSSGRLARVPASRWSSRCRSRPSPFRRRLPIASSDGHVVNPLRLRATCTGDLRQHSARSFHGRAESH